MIKPLVLFFFVFAFMLNANAQALNDNSITPPAVVSGNGSITPGTIVGSVANVTNGAAVSSACIITYSWESSYDGNFSTDVVTNLADTKDYNPGTLTRTTYFRRTVVANCPDLNFLGNSTTPRIKFTVN